jgi:hypothetical protein
MCSASHHKPISRQIGSISSRKASRNKEPTRGKEQVTYMTINTLIGRTRVLRIEGGSINEDTADGDDDDENEDDARR